MSSGIFGLALAVNGDILAANGNDRNMVVTKPNGVQIDTILLDPAAPGSSSGSPTFPGKASILSMMGRIL